MKVILNVFMPSKDLGSIVLRPGPIYWKRITFIATLFIGSTGPIPLGIIH